MIIGLLLILGFLPVKKYPEGLNIDERQVSLVITESTTEDDLRQYKEILLNEQNIDFNYSLSKNKRGLITSIYIEVDCQDGFKGSYFGEQLKQGQKVGFVRIYQMDKYDKWPFFIGQIH